MDYIISEEELIKIILGFNINTDVIGNYVLNFLKSKTPVEVIANGTLTASGQRGYIIKVKGVYHDLEHLFDKKALWGKSGTLIWLPDKK